MRWITAPGWPGHLLAAAAGALMTPSLAPFGWWPLALLSLGLMPAQPADWDMAWRMALCGAGFALFQSPNNHTIVTSAPLHRSGAASGMLGTARLTGQTLGAVLLAAIFALRPGHDGSAESLALLLAAGWAVAAGVCSSLRVRQGPV